MKALAKQVGIKITSQQQNPQEILKKKKDEYLKLEQIRYLQQQHIKDVGASKFWERSLITQRTMPDAESIALAEK